jgi:APA family basic amino acid/polyamine antiporter
MLYVLFTGSDLAEQAGFDLGIGLYLTGFVATLGAGALLTQAVNWGGLVAFDLASLSTLKIYVPWMAVGLAIFGFYWYRGEQRDKDVEAILDTLPGVASTDRNRDVGGVSDD